MITLLDVNVLIALAWPNHIHHLSAQRWFRENLEDGWATCPVTQSGFVRVSSNRSALPDAKSPHEAILLLRRIVERPGHVFWDDDVSLATSQDIDPSRLQGHRQVTDAHLVALALRRGGRLATLDETIRQLVPKDRRPEETVRVIPGETLLERLAAEAEEEDPQGLTEEFDPDTP